MCRYTCCSGRFAHCHAITQMQPNMPAVKAQEVCSILLNDRCRHSDTILSYALMGRSQNRKPKLCQKCFVFVLFAKFLSQAQPSTTHKVAKIKRCTTDQHGTRCEVKIITRRLRHKRHGNHKKKALRLLCFLLMWFMRTK